MSLEGKYMIAFTKGMDVEEYEGPGSVVEHEMELHIKYDFTCFCGNECTFYQRKGPISPYECSECGQKYDDNVIPSKGTMTLELKKQEIKNSIPQVAN